MHNTYIAFLGDINDHIEKHFANTRAPFKIIGYAALELAGLPERGTKDMDALKTDILIDPEHKPMVDYLSKEFGKKSPGQIRHGIYLDLVEKNIPWLPVPPKFIAIRSFPCVEAYRLEPVDVCVSKIFSFCKSSAQRPNDRDDIFATLDRNIIELEAMIGRLDETLPHYETHASAAEIFQKVMAFVKNDILVRYKRTNISLKYELPNWMENI